MGKSRDPAGLPASISLYTVPVLCVRLVTGTIKNICATGPIKQVLLSLSV